MEFLKRLPGRAAAAVFVAALSLSPAAQEPARGESTVKAAFLYNFTKFVAWPDAAFSAPDAPFVVCALASETFRRELALTFEKEHVRGRDVELQYPASAAAARGCHLVYIAPKGGPAALQLAPLRGLPILAVGEGREFLEHGGHIAFKLNENRVRFEISKRAADAAGLQVSSKLLRLAEDVID